MDNAERLAALKNMADADPDNELAHFTLGRAYLAAEEFSAAETALLRTLELNPQHSVAHQGLADALLKQGRREEAIERLKEGVTIAHRKGEFKPRNEMQATLTGLGVILPALDEADVEGTEEIELDENSLRCRRCGRVGPRLPEAPFPSPLGEEILANTCVPCWREWMGVSIKVINEFRLNMMLPEAQEVYDTHMKEFLALTGE